MERRSTKEELLTNITIYWVTETINSSMRLYKEALNRLLHFRDGERVQSPCGVARFSGGSAVPAA